VVSTRPTQEAAALDVPPARTVGINGTTLPERYLVWDRTKILPGTELYIRGGNETSSGYAAQEWRAFYKLLCGLSRERVVNSLESRSCMIKPYQQAIAASVGFRVPPTLVTNDKSSVQAFQQQNEGQMRSLAPRAIPIRVPGAYSDYLYQGIYVRRCQRVTQVNAADSTYRRALERGASSLEEPFDTPYGDRRCMVEDN
jgi:hypothetical protein